MNMWFYSNATNTKYGDKNKIRPPKNPKWSLSLNESESAPSDPVALLASVKLTCVNTVSAAARCAYPLINKLLIDQLRF